MSLKKISPDDLKDAFPRFESVTEVDRGGQKVVYRVEEDGTAFAFKVLELRGDGGGAGEGPSQELVDEVVARAKREVKILTACKSPYVVKPGPLALGTKRLGDVEVVFYSEEWIDGLNLKRLIANQGPLEIDDLVILGTHVVQALDEVWSLKKVHRDIKPGNVMRRSSDGAFVVLDLGLALDLEDESLTRVVGAIPGTPIYFSPERLDLSRKRDLDFRSDLFSLGILLYEAATGSHPFWSPGERREKAVGRILNDPHAPPSSLRNELPPEFDEVVGTMLEKKPHLRYRKCSLAIEALEGVRGL